MRPQSSAEALGSAICTDCRALTSRSVSTCPERTLGRAARHVDVGVLADCEPAKGREGFLRCVDRKVDAALMEFGVEVRGDRMEVEPHAGCMTAERAEHGSEVGEERIVEPRNAKDMAELLDRKTLDFLVRVVNNP